MSKIKKKPEKQIRYDGEFLYQRVNGTEENLGKINTHKGQLTRYEKLRAVGSQDKWVVI